VVDLEEGAKQLALTAARAAAAEAALHGGPEVALLADGGRLAGPCMLRRAHRFLDLPRFILPDFFLSGLRFPSCGLRPGRSFARVARSKRLLFLSRGMT